MISRGVEISIAGGGEEMVRVYLVVVFFFISFFSFYIIYSLFMVQELACSPSYGVKKTL